MDWFLLQLADSAFPTGGFAHSNGFEAALSQGEIHDIPGFEIFLTELLWQTGHGALPLATEAHAQPERIGELDALCDAFLSSHVANRASRVQGRTFLATCERAFRSEPLERLGGRVRGAKLHEHFGPIFGAVLRTMDVKLESMQRLLLHGTLRSVISAAVRLGVFGPYQGQRIQAAFAATLDEVLNACGGLTVAELAQTAPLLDLVQANHDRLYSRLFQS